MVSHPSNTSIRVMIYNLLIPFGTFIIIQMGIAEPKVGQREKKMVQEEMEEGSRRDPQTMARPDA